VPARGTIGAVHRLGRHRLLGPLLLLLLAGGCADGGEQVDAAARALEQVGAGLAAADEVAAAEDTPWDEAAPTSARLREVLSPAVADAVATVLEAGLPTDRDDLAEVVAEAAEGADALRADLLVHAVDAAVGDGAAAVADEDLRGALADRLDAAAAGTPAYDAAVAAADGRSTAEDVAQNVLRELGQDLRILVDADR
jgi:hypothetical protein